MTTPWSVKNELKGVSFRRSVSGSQQASTDGRPGSSAGAGYRDGRRKGLTKSDSCPETQSLPLDCAGPDFGSSVLGGSAPGASGADGAPASPPVSRT